MRHTRNPILWRIRDQGLEHPARTTVAAMASLVVASACRLPEAYWAPVTTIVVMQSTLGAALKVSGQRFAGTALGAAAGALLAMYFPPTAIVFGSRCICDGAYLRGAESGPSRVPVRGDHAGDYFAGGAR